VRDSRATVTDSSRASAVPTAPFIRMTDVHKVYRLEAGIFASSGRWVWALNGVTLDIRRGETYGLVGESGSGKTTLARVLVQLTPHTEGTIEYFPPDEETGRPVSHADRAFLARVRRDVKYVFQDPSTSLDPRMDVFHILTAGAKHSGMGADPTSLRARAKETLEAVGLRSQDLERRPSEFSGGQRQRISLARALFYGPRALICDEVVSALDVSIQGQILNLLVSLKKRYKLTILFIAHDLTVVSYMADRICVLYGGSIMEEAPTAELVKNPLHPYTKMLYGAIPRLGERPPESPGPAGAPAFQGRGTASGTPFNPTRPPVGCPFAGRCPIEREVCFRVKPQLREISPGHRVACHFA
jgi:oligopeptide/dipeptide ABC transporter ATP-binding protein